MSQPLDGTLDQKVVRNWAVLLPEVYRRKLQLATLLIRCFEQQCRASAERCAKFFLETHIATVCGFHLNILKEDLVINFITYI